MKRTQKTLQSILFVSVLALSAIPPVYGDTLEKALAAAYKNNSEIAGKRADARATSERVSQANSGFRPRLDASASLSYGRTNSSGTDKDNLRNTPSSQDDRTAKAGVTLSQNLYAGGGTVAASCEATNTYLAAAAGLSVFEQKILLDVIDVYLSLFSQKAKITLYKSNVDLLQQTLTSANEKFKVGEETRTSVAQAEAKLAEGESQLKTAEAAAEAFEATYIRLTGLVKADPETPKDFTQIPATLKEALDKAKNNPAITAAKYEETASRHGIDKATAGLKPKVDFDLAATRNETRTRGNYGLIMPNVELNGKNYATNQAATISVRMPLYEGGQIRSQVREAHQLAQSRRVGVETARRAVAENVTQAWKGFQSASANIKNFEKQVSAAEISLEGTRQEMLVGSKVLLEVLRAQSDLLEAKLRLVDAKKTYYTEGFRLLSAMGMLTAEKLKLKADRYNPDHYYHEIKNKWY